MKGNNNPSKESYKMVYSQPFFNLPITLDGFFYAHEVFIIKNKMNKLILEELGRIKDLFDYKKGQVISEQVTAKQKEAMNAGWGPVTDETAKSLPVGPDGKILPKKVETATDEFSKFPCVKSLKTEKKATAKEVAVPMKIGEGNLKQYYFGADGTLYSYGQEYGKWSCGTKPNTILINDKEVTVGIPSTMKPKLMVKIPKELKDIEGVKKFQDWMDANHPNWVKGKNLNKGGGYGKFGPNTTAAWNKYKNEYLNTLTSSSDSSQPINKLMAGTKDFPGAFNRGGPGVPDEEGGELYTIK